MVVEHPQFENLQGNKMVEATFSIAKFRMSPARADILRQMRSHTGTTKGKKKGRVLHGSNPTTAVPYFGVR